MRNLRTVGRSLLRFAAAEADPLPLTATAWDSASDGLICAFGPSESRAVLELKRLRSDHTTLESIAEWDAPCPLPSLACDVVLDLHHFSDASTSCLVLAGGDIVLVREQPLAGEELVEIVGSVDAGIAAAAWSPDEELLAIVTQADTLLFMTRDIENIVSVAFSPEDASLSKHVSVGWGKAETQFKGKRARALQDPTMPERVDEGVLSPYDDSSVNISWRGDGAFVAINSIEQDKRRMIRVYSREGQIDSVSEPVDGLEGALSWRPSGNLIAGVRRAYDRLDVVFFERNGLRHGQFDLRVSSKDLEELKSSLKLRWNSDSSVLAVCYPQKVQLWTMSNYHYYLKQEVAFEDFLSGGAICKWHPEKALCATMATPGSLQVLEYLAATVTGPVSPPHDYGAVVSIDGLTLHVTPLRVANIPPPMSLHQLSLKVPPTDVAISMTGSRLAVLSNRSVSLYSVDVTRRPMPRLELLWQGDLLDGYYGRQLTFLGDDRLFVLGDSWEDSESGLWEVKHNSLAFLGAVGNGKPVSVISNDLDYQNLYLQGVDGAILKLQSGETDINTPPSWVRVNKFPSPAHEMRVSRHGTEDLYFGLAKSGVLFANERVLVRNCTSFMVTPAHLVLTTTQNYLKFVHITDSHELEVPPDEPQKDERCRSIERGARIVTGMPTTYAIVLQMPRGNLETIYPRALVLAAIRRNIEAKRYDQAFLICRTQRVDMNILHDHAPEQFIQNIPLILKQIKRVDYIDLLLSQLRDEDVAETMYKETLPSSALNNTVSQKVTGTASSRTSSKVNRICDGFISVLQQDKLKAGHIQNIITAHVCKVPSDLEAGLDMIGRLQEAEDPLTEKAAEHICFLADVNKLYDTALGIYNLTLALLIAEQSQKDPREYLPYLQSLQEMSPLRRKFSIDNDLGRHVKALRHLSELDAFDEFTSYMVKHKLFTDALEIYRYDEKRLDAVMRLYAGYLSSTNRHKEAGIAYEYLSDYSSAWPCYRAANLWRESLSSATLADLPSSEFESLALTLAEGLVEAKDYLGASAIYLEYLSNLPTATKFLVKGHHVGEAIRLVTLHRQPELITEVIDPALMESSGSMTEFLAECKGQLLAQVPRVRELRVKKAEDPFSFFGESTDNPDIPDNISLAPTDTTSGGTLLTRYTSRTGTVNTSTTRRTSKNKRREERKRARGKKGSVYEEEYLLNSIERLIARVNGMSEEVGRLIDGLVRRRMVEQARAVEGAMKEVGKLCEDAVAELYVQGQEGENESAQNGVAENLDGEPKPTGGDAVLWASLEEGSKKRDVPVMKKFEGLSLFG